MFQRKRTFPAVRVSPVSPYYTFRVEYADPATALPGPNPGRFRLTDRWYDYTRSYETSDSGIMLSCESMRERRSPGWKGFRQHVAESTAIRTTSALKQWGWEFGMMPPLIWPGKGVRTSLTRYGEDGRLNFRCENGAGEELFTGRAHPELMAELARTIPLEYRFGEGEWRSIED